MALRSTGRTRLLLMGLALAGAFGGAHAAKAQYYYQFDDMEPEGYGVPYAAPPLPPRAIGPLARRGDRLALDYGLVHVERRIRTYSSYVVDGIARNGIRTRLIFDARTGELVDRVALPQRPAAQSERLARIAPGEKERTPRRRLVPQPPERPTALPRPTPPAEASAPAAAMPGPPARPTIPSPAPADAPRLQNPADVRDAGQDERLPPLARAAQNTTISVPPVILPPLQLDDIAPPPPAGTKD